MLSEVDSLRAADQIFNPDPRTFLFVRVDTRTGQTRPTTPADQHSAVADFVLNATVPERVRVHFETAKNLYVYAWFVYRFYPVAEQQAFGSLEFALRERQVEFVKRYVSRHRRGAEPGLGALLNNAIKERLVCNDAFRARERWAHRRAVARYHNEQREKMRAEGLSEMVIDDSKVTVSEEDLNHDWLRDFLEAIPYLRNVYAHGSDMLHRTVLHTFEVVAELINQLYPLEIPSKGPGAII